MKKKPDNQDQFISRRQFLFKSGLGIGGMGLASLLTPEHLVSRSNSISRDPALDSPHFVPKAKRVIYLFQSGAPSQHDLFDYKPKLNQMDGESLPSSVRGNQRLTNFENIDPRLPIAGARYEFSRHGKSGAWVSELLPHTAKIVDDLCIVKSVYTEEINHAPAATYIQTGNPRAGNPSIGSWVSYGLGSENENMPAFVVLLSDGTGLQNPIALSTRFWGHGFLPSQHQGIQFRSGQDPVLFLNNPSGVKKINRREMLNGIKQLNKLHMHSSGDHEIYSEIAKHEMAYRMQSSAPETMDVTDEPDWVFDMYGEDARTPGTYAANCLLARRLAERDVRFIQLYHRGWDQHTELPQDLPNQCRDTDQASAALVMDLKQRGLLDDTLVVWGGEFGRTAFCQGPLNKETYGRDHHPGCFTVWFAGGGTKAGITYGKTDEFGYNIVENPVHIHDLQATLLYLLGVDHEKLIYQHQGRRFRLTDVHGEVVHDILT